MRERDRERREGDDQREAKARDLLFHLFAAARDLHEIDADVADVDDALDDAQPAPVRARRVAAAKAADLRRDAKIGELGQRVGEERARRLDLMGLVVEPRDLPIPARARQFELRIAELARAGAALLVPTRRRRRRWRADRRRAAVRKPLPLRFGSRR